MSIVDIFKGMTASEIEEMFNSLDDAFDEYFGSHGQRRRFMEACRHLSNHDMATVHSVMNGSDDADDPASLAQDIEDPARVVDALLMLEDDLQETKDTNLLLFLLALLQRDKVAKKIERARAMDWEYPLLENKKTPAEFIQFLWDLLKKGRYGNLEWYESPRTVARHPNCPLPVLREMAKSDDAPLRLAVARHRNIDDKLINRFLNSTRKPEREQIAKSRHVPAEALMSLMRDQHDSVKRIAGRQFAKRFPDIEVTKEAIEAAVAARIDNPYVAPENPTPKFNKYAFHQTSIEEILSLKPAQRASAVDVVRDVEILLALADDRSAPVRRAVAGKGHLPEETLEGFLTDSDFIVVSKALQNLARKRPEASFEDLAPAAVVEESHALLNTYVNEKGKLQPVMEKLNARTEAEIERVKLVASYSNNPMIQMRLCNDLKAIPNSFTMRWNLLSCLADNLHLTETAIRKIAFDLGFGGERVLLNCKDPALIQEYLQRDKIAPGERGRLEQHVEALLAGSAE